MRKLIEMRQEDLIVCDNPNCSYKVKNETKDPNVSVHDWLDVPCPNCGQPLLTLDDYLRALHILRIINWVNRWFSWMTIFIPKNKKFTHVMIKTHKKIIIEKQK